MNGFNLYEDISYIELLIQEKEALSQKLQYEIDSLYLLLKKLTNEYNKK